MNASERARAFVEDYFMMDTPLYFSYTHLVCRTALKGINLITLSYWLLIVQLLGLFSCISSVFLGHFILYFLIKYILPFFYQSFFLFPYFVIFLDSCPLIISIFLSFFPFSCLPSFRFSFIPSFLPSFTQPFFPSSIPSVLHPFLLPFFL